MSASQPRGLCGRRSARSSPTGRNPRNGNNQNAVMAPPEAWKSADGVTGEKNTTANVMKSASAEIVKAHAIAGCVRTRLRGSATDSCIDIRLQQSLALWHR